MLRKQCRRALRLALMPRARFVSRYGVAAKRADSGKPVVNTDSADGDDVADSRKTRGRGRPPGKKAGSAATGTGKGAGGRRGKKSGADVEEETDTPEGGLAEAGAGAKAEAESAGLQGADEGEPVGKSEGSKAKAPEPAEPAAAAETTQSAAGVEKLGASDTADVGGTVSDGDEGDEELKEVWCLLEEVSGHVEEKDVLEFAPALSEPFKATVGATKFFKERSVLEIKVSEELEQQDGFRESLKGAKITCRRGEFRAKVVRGDAEWHSTEFKLPWMISNEYLGKRVRWEVWDHDKDKNSHKDATVWGWLPEGESDFEIDGKIVALWRIKFEQESLLPADLEEYEVKKAIESYKEKAQQKEQARKSEEERRRKGRADHLRTVAVGGKRSRIRQQHGSSSSSSGDEDDDEDENEDDDRSRSKRARRSEKSEGDWKPPEAGSDEKAVKGNLPPNPHRRQQLPKQKV